MDMLDRWLHKRFRKNDKEFKLWLFTVIEGLEYPKIDAVYARRIYKRAIYDVLTVLKKEL